MQHATVDELGRAARPTVHHYQWTDGSHHKADPASVAERFRAIYEAQKQITPAAVVADARPAKSVLHPEFTWDDKAAAELYREHEAAYVMRSHMTVYEIKSDRGSEVQPPQRTIVKLELRGADEPQSDDAKRWVQPGSYAPLVAILDDEEARRLYVRNAWLDLRSQQRKYRDVSEFAMIWDAVDLVGRDLGLLG